MPNTLYSIDRINNRYQFVKKNGQPSSWYTLSTSRLFKDLDMSESSFVSKERRNSNRDTLLCGIWRQLV